MTDINKETIAVGDIIENTDLNIHAEVTAIDEENLTVKWFDGENVVEEVINLSELSPETLNSYVHKARFRPAMKNPEYDTYTGGVSGGNIKHQEKWAQRQKSVKKAMGKLGSNFKPTLYDKLVGHIPGKDVDENINQKENTVENREGRLAEDGVALDSLRPNSHPEVDNPKSKLEVMKAVIGKLGAMEDNEAVAFFHKAIADIGHEGDPAPDAAVKNKHSIDAHPSDAVGKSVKEDVAKLFEGAEVTDEFKEKTTLLFEAALMARMGIYEAELEDASAELLNETVEQLEEDFGNTLTEIDEQVETYMDYVATKWLEENKIAIESSLRSDLTREFIDGLKSLFDEHYIDLPESKVDVVNSLAEQVEELQSKLSEAIEETVKLREVISEVTAEEAFEEVAEGLAITEVDKFRLLSESVDFEGDVDKFKSKLKLIRESHFANKKEPKVTLTDEFHGNEKVLTENVDPRVARYVNNLSASKLR